jgi:hypothetical protein
MVRARVGAGGSSPAPSRLLLAIIQARRADVRLRTLLQHLARR